MLSDEEQDRFANAKAVAELIGDAPSQSESKRTVQQHQAAATRLSASIQAEQEMSEGVAEWPDN